MKIIRVKTNKFKEACLRKLFDLVGQRVVSLLNYGAGRSGDLPALSRVTQNIAVMVALDLSGESLKELCVRYHKLVSDMKVNYKLYPVEADFTERDLAHRLFSTLKEHISDKDDRRLLYLKDSARFSIVLINLAIHYSCSDANMIERFWHNLKNLTYKKSWILITYYRAAKLKKLPTKLLEPDQKTQMGQMTISDNTYTVTLGSSLKDVKEYFVDEELLEKAASKAGFQQVLSIEYEDIIPLEEETDSQRYLRCLCAKIYQPV